MSKRVNNQDNSLTPEKKELLKMVFMNMLFGALLLCIGLWVFKFSGDLFSEDVKLYISMPMMMIGMLFMAYPKIIKPTPPIQ